MILYHGTTKKALMKILKEGIEPRGKKKSNWEKGIGKSRPDLVYLTNCYACYYASMACKKDNDIAVVLKLEIDSTKIALYPDEEFLFRATGIEKRAKNQKEAIKLYEAIDPKRTDLFFNKIANRQINWKDSLNYMGTVTADFVPRECVVGYYAEKKKLEFILNCDPSVSPLNYKFCGQQYKDYLKSLDFIKVNN